MKEFFIVCKWDDYYPRPGIENIILVTFDLEEALAVQNKWVEDGEWLTGYDNCDVFSSNLLPWSTK